KADYERLIKELSAGATPPECIAHLWTAVPGAESDGHATFEQEQIAGFHSLVYLAQGLEKNNITTAMHLAVVSTALHATSTRDVVSPSKRTVLGPCKVLPQEYSNLRCKSIDIGDALDPDAAAHIIAELLAQTVETVVAYRDGTRWVEEFEPLPLGEVPADSITLRKRGVYLITGGLGNIGLEVAQALAETVQARLVLVGRSEFPDRSTWETQVAASPH